MAVLPAYFKPGILFNLDIYPTITLQCPHIVLGDYFVRGIFEVHLHVFEVGNYCAVGVILDVNEREF